MTPARAAALLEQFERQDVLVAGDMMLDRFIVGRVARISPEAPVPVVQFQSEHTRLGGAANVAHNIVALGGHASVIGIVGDDRAGTALVEKLSAAGVDVSGLVRDPTRPTTEKVRVVTDRNQQVARIDYERDTDAPPDIERALVQHIERLAARKQALLVSDYLKGSITPAITEALRRAAARPNGARAPLIIDPKIPHLSCYTGAALLTPNLDEAETATHMRIRSDDEARTAARALRAHVRSEAVLITRGEQGMWLSCDAVDTAIPAIAREVADVTGAGDTVVATLALALAAGASLVEAATLASHAAGVAVGRFGPAAVAREEVLASFARVSAESAAGS